MIEHEIRTKAGGVETVKLSPRLAIVRMCRECLGFETYPGECTSPKCPVYPFRTGEAHSGKKISAAQVERVRLLGLKRRRG